MSIHKSLASKGKLRRTRNVLKRAERIHELEHSGRWKPELNSPYG
ncbi:MAG: small basic protein, partial [Anaerolineales bacterium]